ncbi:MAG: hypothetical protein G5663_04660 [Serratia symbiotica]|nr:hypothetical protein [Serratia symbiotica]
MAHIFLHGERQLPQQQLQPIVLLDCQTLLAQKWLGFGSCQRNQATKR